MDPAPPSRTNAGFTLFELLVTVAIIGIVTGMAVLALGDNRMERLKRSARQLGTLVALAQEQALFNGEELGVEFDEHGYTFYQLLDGKWRELTGDPELKSRALPVDTSLTLYLEGLRVDLGQAATGLKDEPEKTPHVLILSDGTVTPFELELGDGLDMELRLSIDPVGHAQIEVTQG